jgi:hypothetical protein
MAGVKRTLGDVSSAQQAQAAQQGKQAIDTICVALDGHGGRCKLLKGHDGPHHDGRQGFYPSAPDLRLHPPVDTYRMVDFVKAVAMRDDRGQEVRVQRIRLGAPVDRESPMKVESIVLNGTWFDVTTVLPQPDGKDNIVRYYRVHVTNVVSAER